MARADRTGITVRAKLREAMVPTSQVTGAIGIPKAAKTRLTPVG